MRGTSFWGCQSSAWQDTSGKAMILNVLTLPAARAAQSLPKRGGDVSGPRNPLRGWAQ